MISVFISKLEINTGINDMKRKESTKAISLLSVLNSQIKVSRCQARIMPTNAAVIKGRLFKKIDIKILKVKTF